MARREIVGTARRGQENHAVQGSEGKVAVERRVVLLVVPRRVRSLKMSPNSSFVKAWVRILLRRPGSASVKR